ncbi:MAG: YidC/Oxa1 family membrane protein insertase [Ilumatobacteraceae bacterium]
MSPTPILAGVFEVPAAVLNWLYEVTGSFTVAISLAAFIVMAIVTPLTLKSTKGMLEMQRLAPEMRRLQQEYRNDRQKLNEEMMRLYQEHKVNPMASCLPLLAQTPVFIVMFRILHDATYVPTGTNERIAQAVLASVGRADETIGFLPRYLSRGSEMYQALVRQTEMPSWGLDLSKSPAVMLGESFGKGLIYAGLVVILGLLYLFQQRMVAARASISPTMSESQQKLMQYLPVVFAVFQIFFLLGLVVYYIVQSVIRIVVQAYITKRFYAGDESLGRQAQAASVKAREISKAEGGGGGLLAQAKRDLTAARGEASEKAERSKNGGEPSGKTAGSAKGSNSRTGGGRPQARPASQSGARRDLQRPGGQRKKKK